MLKFLDNVKSKQAIKIKFKSPSSLMSFKAHFLHNFFPKKVEGVSEDQEERFDQDVKEIKKRYQGHVTEMYKMPHFAEKSP